MSELGTLLKALEMTASRQTSIFRLLRTNCAAWVLPIKLFPGDARWYRISRRASFQASGRISLRVMDWQMPYSLCFHVLLNALEDRRAEWRVEKESRDFRMETRMSTGSWSIETMVDMGGYLL